jgi:hypothetical protein
MCTAPQVRRPQQTGLSRPPFPRTPGRRHFAIACSSCRPPPVFFLLSQRNWPSYGSWEFERLFPPRHGILLHINFIELPKGNFAVNCWRSPLCIETAASGWPVVPTTRTVRMDRSNNGELFVVCIYKLRVCLAHLTNICRTKTLGKPWLVQKVIKVSLYRKS